MKANEYYVSGISKIFIPSEPVIAFLFFGNNLKYLKDKTELAGGIGQTVA